MQKDKSVKIYVAGHRGVAGKACTELLRKEGYLNILTRTHKELDLTCQSAVFDFFEREKPDWVILCAARIGGIADKTKFPAEFIYDNLMIETNVIEAAQRSPVYKMAMDWKLALPLHPEYRTLPMVWYVPPLSPIQSYADAGGLPKSEGVLPAIESLRIPVQYLANMLSAGDTGPVLRALKRMMAMRHYMRSQTVEGVTDTRAIDEVGLSVAQVEEMYRYLAIANYEDRFVIPTSHREMAGDAFAERNGCGFTFGDGCHGSDSKFNLFNSSRIDAINITEVRDKAEGE